MELKITPAELQNFIIFDNLAKKKTIRRIAKFMAYQIYFQKLADEVQSNPEKKDCPVLNNDWINKFISDYADIVRVLCKKNLNLSEYLFDKIISDYNFYLKSIQKKREIDKRARERMDIELEMLRQLGRCSIEDILGNIKKTVAFIEKNGNPYRTPPARWTELKKSLDEITKRLSTFPVWETSDIDYISDYNDYLTKIAL